MRSYREKLQLKTTKEFDVIDITTDVEKAVITSSIQDGFALVFSPHTTCAVLINEKESGLLADIEGTLHRLVPKQDGYHHDNFDIRTENMHDDETENAHSHMRQVLSGHTSEHVPIGDGSLLLGTWQRIMFIEYDRPRDREVIISVFGT